jgi:glycine dehydrogenase subunit 1
MRTPIPAAEVAGRLLDSGIVGGLPLGQFDPALDHLMTFAVTEMNDREHIDELVTALAGVHGSTSLPERATVGGRA